MLAHNVFFALDDNSQASRDRLVEACRRYLSDHPGTVFFAAGALCDALAREVNVRDFDVALHVIFTDQAAHDAYQISPAHQTFIDENKANWRNVRVFDSQVEGAGGGA